MADKLWEKARGFLSKVYSEDQVEYILEQAENLRRQNESGAKSKGSLQDKITYKDAAVVVYANSIVDPDGKDKPLAVLREFIERFSLDEVITVIHILPFYPWDTDRGFSVKDYYKVYPEYGDWQDIKSLAEKSRLMFDFVLNHASIDNPLVQYALIQRHIDKDDPQYSKYAEYKDFVIAFDDESRPSDAVLSKLTHPRPNPVLTPYVVFKKMEAGRSFYKAILGRREYDPKEAEVIGEGWVWTTFSRPRKADGSEDTRQVDLNYANPKVLVEALKIMLFYIKQGASFLRLDAVGYLWKELGTPSVHHKKTHNILKFMREFLNITAPDVVFIAEVNERFDKVVEYLGEDNAIESDIVYQFTNFVLAVYSLFSQDPSLYADWYKKTKKVKGRQFVTVLGTHDGMGIKPLRGILSDEAIEEFAYRVVKEHNALPNFAYLPGGKKIIYELCSTPWNLINGEGIFDEQKALRRYLMIFALGLMVKGLPAVYINGLLGSKNYLPEKGLDENRTVNREVFWKEKLFAVLGSEGRQKKIFSEIQRILRIRSRIRFFSPWEFFPQLKTEGSLLIFFYPDESISEFLAVYNFSEKEKIFRFSGRMKDLITDRILEDRIKMPSFGFAWLLRKK